MANPKQLIYRNSRYGFTLRFPSWWKNYTVVGKEKQDPGTEYELHFRFRYKGRVYDDIFAVLVYRMTRKAWKEQGYDDSPLVVVAEHGGRIFAALTPEELPDAFIDPKTGNYDYKRYGTAIELLKRMVNHDVPRIIRSVRFGRWCRSVLPAPYRAKQICACRIRKQRR